MLHPEATDARRHFIEDLRRGELRCLGCRGRSGPRQVCVQEVGTEFPFAFDLDAASAIARVTQGLQGPRCLLSHLQLEEGWVRECRGALALSPPLMPPSDSHLDLAENACALHSAGHIHCVPPDVVLWLLRPNHPCYYWSVVQP